MTAGAALRALISRDAEGAPEVFVITGAGAGVGRATARRLARDGARIGLLGRGADALEESRREVEATGGQALAVQTDVADPAAVEAAADEVEDALGPIDVWINNAMTTVFAFLSDVTPEEYRRATEVTYLGTVWGTKAALDRMLPRDRGTIVQVGSALAYRGIPLQAPYCGAKHAVKGFVESLRCELRHRDSNVHVTMVQLPGLNTPQFEQCRSKMPRHPMPVPPTYQPEVAADAIRWAARHRRRESHVGLPAVYTIWGAKLAPWLAEWHLARTGIEDQQADEEPSERNREGNLFAPHPGDPGAQGRFGDGAHRRSPQWWLSRNRRMVGGVLAGAAAMTFGVRLARR
jgi:NAD(P)-dependent dehydrogenase (short-subunit alcohol dehydrogenase family)